MTIISVVGPKGGIGKTTLSINATAALTRLVESDSPRQGVGLIDLDLRLLAWRRAPRRAFGGEEISGLFSEEDFSLRNGW